MTRAVFGIFRTISIVTALNDIFKSFSRSELHSEILNPDRGSDSQQVRERG